MVEEDGEEDEEAAGFGRREGYRILVKEEGGWPVLDGFVEREEGYRFWKGWPPTVDEERYCQILVEEDEG